MAKASQKSFHEPNIFVGYLSFEVAARHNAFYTVSDDSFTFPYFCLCIPVFLSALQQYVNTFWQKEKKFDSFP